MHIINLKKRGRLGLPETILVVACLSALIYNLVATTVHEVTARYAKAGFAAEAMAAYHKIVAQVNTKPSTILTIPYTEFNGQTVVLEYNTENHTVALEVKSATGDFRDENKCLAFLVNEVKRFKASVAPIRLTAGVSFHFQGGRPLYHPDQIVDSKSGVHQRLLFAEKAFVNDGVILASGRETVRGQYDPYGTP